MEYYKRKKELLEDCSKGFYPHIDRVLERIPQQIRDNEVLNDPTLKIISFEAETDGRYIPFASPVQHLIILNESILKELEFKIVHTIAHEIAHKVVGKGETLYMKKKQRI